ncbi:MAG: Holliday junction resolvase RuvX [Pseudomonadota bacterium]
MDTDLTPETFLDQLPERSCLLGLDLGSKTIGMAISDPDFIAASPVGTIRKKKFSIDAQNLINVIMERSVGGLVLGLPVNMDGSEGPRVQSTRAFARNFLALQPMPLLYWDERLSTVAAERAMIDADLSRRKRAENVDQIAASLILQGCLERLSVIRAQRGAT